MLKPHQIRKCKYNIGSRDPGCLAKSLNQRLGNAAVQPSPLAANTSVSFGSKGSSITVLQKTPSHLLNITKTPNSKTVKCKNHFQFTGLESLLPEAM